MSIECVIETMAEISTESSAPVAVVAQVVDAISQMEQTIQQHAAVAGETAGHNNRLLLRRLRFFCGPRRSICRRCWVRYADRACLFCWVPLEN